MFDQLIPIEKLMEHLGYADIRSVRKWCDKNKVPIIDMGKRSYTLSPFLNLMVEGKFSVFAEATYVTPNSVVESVKNNNSVNLSKLIVAPINKVAKQEHKQDTHSRASERFRKKLKL